MEKLKKSTLVKQAIVMKTVLHGLGTVPVSDVHYDNILMLM